MKICPRCQSVFADEFNYCLEDGTTLTAVEPHDPQKTLSFAEEPTLQKANPGTAKQNKQTGAQIYSSLGQPAGRGKSPLFILLVILGGALLLVSGVFGGAYYLSKKAVSMASVTPTPTPFLIKTPTIPVIPKSKDLSQKASLKIDVIGKVKGSFGMQYLKCLVTNTGDQIVSSPTVSVTLYKDDVKIDTVFERADLKYLKPQQTIPIWADLPKNADYNRTTAEPGFTTGSVDKTAEEIYSDLIYTGTQMTSKKGTSSYNFRPYTEIFYTVSGIVENQNYDKISPNIYVFYYDENKEIVGIGETSVGELKKGEKAKFEISKGDTQLFGTPKTFEIFSTSD